MTPEEKLAQRGFALSAPPAPAANYVPVTRMGNQLFVSGQVSVGPNGLVSGQLGRDIDTAAGQKAAELCAINILAQLRFSADVSLSRIRLLKLTVLVASVPEFTEQHLVANGASDLFVEVWAIMAAMPGPLSASPPCPLAPPSRSKRWSRNCRRPRCGRGSSLRHLSALYRRILVTKSLWNDPIPRLRPSRRPSRLA